MLNLAIIFTLVAVYTTSSLRTEAGTINIGGPCSITRNHLDPNTHKLISDCSDLTYCSGENGTCLARTCRRDEFPFGYSATDVLPPLCPLGSFCPDEGDGCRVQVSAGGECQMNRWIGRTSLALGTFWFDFFTFYLQGWTVRSSSELAGLL